jgi:molecular chaperone DnaK
MTITGGSSLPKEDIERMVREAEEHAAEDKQKRDEQDLRNIAEQIVYQSEKTIRENDQKLPEDLKVSVQAEIDLLKTALAGDDIEAIKSASEALGKSQQPLAEAVAAAGANETEAADGEEAEASNEDVVEAEVVDEDEEEKK